MAKCSSVRLYMQTCSFSVSLSLSGHDLDVKGRAHEPASGPLVPPPPLPGFRLQQSPKNSVVFTVAVSGVLDYFGQCGSLQHFLLSAPNASHYWMSHKWLMLFMLLFMLLSGHYAPLDLSMLFTTLCTISELNTCV